MITKTMILLYTLMLACNGYTWFAQVSPDARNPWMKGFHCHPYDQYNDVLKTVILIADLFLY